MMFKTCTKCGETKEDIEFPIDKRWSENYRGAMCKKCKNKQANEARRRRMEKKDVGWDFLYRNPMKV